MKTAFYSFIAFLFFSIASFGQKKIEMVCKSPSGETVKYKVESFTYTIFNRDSITTVAQFYVILKQRPDKFIFQWRAKPTNVVDGTVRLLNTATGKTEQTFDFKSALLTSLTDTLESDRSSLNIEVKDLTVDGVKIESK